MCCVLLVLGSGVAIAAPLFQETFDGPAALGNAAFDTQFLTGRVQAGALHLFYSTEPNSQPNALSCMLPAVSRPPEERRTVLHFGGGGADVSNSVFVSYAVGPGDGLSLIPFPYGPLANGASGYRAGYVIRFLRHGDGTNEIEIYRNDTGWIRKLLNDWLPSNPVRTLRRIDIRHRRNGEHLIAVRFDTGVAYERTYRFIDASFPPGNLYRGIQFIAKAHSAMKTELTYQTDTWIVVDEYGPGARRPEPRNEPAARAIQKPSAPMEEMVARAESLFAQSDTQSAADLCLQILNQDGDHADAQDMLGRIERLSGNLSDAHRLLSRALDARRRAYPPDHPKVAESMLHLAGLFAARDSARADSLYQGAVEIMEKRLGTSHPDLVPFLHEQARFHEYQKTFSKAGPMYLRILSILENSYGLRDLRLLPVLTDVGKLCAVTKQYAPSDSFLSRALEIGQTAYGETHPAVITALQALELLYELQHLDDKSEPVYRRLIEFQTRRSGDLTHTARRMNNLGMIYQRKSHFQDAETMFLKSIETWTRAMGPGYFELPDILGNLSLLYQATGQLEKAEAVYLRGLEIRKKEQGTNHPEVARTLNNLATLNHQLKRFDRAIQYYQEALAALDNATDPEVVNQAHVCYQLLTLYSARDQYLAAEQAGRRALSVFEKEEATLRPHLLATLRALSRLYDKMGRSMEASYFAHRAGMIEMR